MLNPWKTSRKAGFGTGHTLNIFDANNQSVINIFGGANIDKSLSNRKVHSVQSHDGELLVGTGNAGIEILSPINGKTGQLWETSENPVETLHAAKDGDVYASSNFATVKIDSATKQNFPLAVGIRNLQHLPLLFYRPRRVCG